MFSWKYHKFRHDKICKIVYYALRKKFGAPAPRDWFNQTPPKSYTFKNHTFEWDPWVNTITNIRSNHPDIIVTLPGGERKIVEIACPCDKNVPATVETKDQRYIPLEIDLSLNQNKPTTAYSIVVGNTGRIPPNLESNITKNLGLPRGTIPHMQRTAAFETAKIVQVLLKNNAEWRLAAERIEREDDDDDVICDEV